MKTEILAVNKQIPEPEHIAKAAEILRNGGLVAFPTETVYGLGADALNPDAVAKIYAAKGRPSHNPLIVHVPNSAAAKTLVTDWPETAEKLANKFWPGPLTLVLPKREFVPDSVTGGGPTVAVRVPAHPIALALLSAIGTPIAAPSANRSEEVSPTAARHVLKSLGGRIPLLLDGGPTTGGLESTVLSLAGTIPLLLRPGLITPAEIEAIIGPITRKENAVVSAAIPFASPGLLARHYAPNARLEIVPATKAAAYVQRLLREGETVGWITQRFAGIHPRLTVATMPDSPTGYAALLYNALHSMDAISVTRIIVDAVPDSDDWLAIQDRLHRAATPKQTSEGEP